MTLDIPHLPARHPAASWRLLLLAILVLCLGCRREAVPGFVVSQEVGGLPPQHRDQITEQLRHYFGTPTSPRLAEPAPERGAAGNESSADGGPKLDGDADEADTVQEAVPLVDVVDRRHLTHGGQVYRDRCAGCHGISGDGNGPAAEYLQPKPRDYRKGIFKFTSTPYGQKPTRADLVRTIRRGAKGTSMPAFPWMSDQDLEAVIDYVIVLSQRGEMEGFLAVVSDDYDEDEAIEEFDFTDALEMVRSRWHEAEPQAVQPVSAPPAYDDASIIAGRADFLSRGCSKCHGEDGRGQTEWLSHEFLAEQAALPADQQIQINYDAWGQPAPAADITARMLHGGRRPIDIYRRIYTGINGTPMPAFGQSLTEEPETLWHLVHYVMSIVEGREVDFPDTAEGSAQDSTAHDSIIHESEGIQESAGTQESAGQGSALKDIKAPSESSQS